MSQNTENNGQLLQHNGQSLEHNRIKTRELENSIIGKNWSIMWQGLYPSALCLARLQRCMYMYMYNSNNAFKQQLFSGGGECFW